MMSCESRHHAIVTRLLTLAGLRDTVDADTVMDVGVGKRYRRGGLPTPDAAVPVSLHADAQHALEITGHSDHATPAWVAALIDRLHTAAEHGSRRALLTMRWLTGGWEEVTPLLTERDRGWLLAASRVGVSIPPPWEAWITRPRPAAVVGRLLGGLELEAVVLTDLLDVLTGIDAVPPAAVQAVTPLQVLRFFLGGSFPSRTDLQQVLRAVLDGAPVVRSTIAQIHKVVGRGGFLSGLTQHLIGRAAHAHTRRCSIEQAGGDALLAFIADGVRPSPGRSIDPAILCDPSASVATVIQALRYRYHGDGSFLPAVMHVWQTRTGSIAQVVQTLAQVLDRTNDKHVTYASTVLPIIAGTVHPPHGDALVAHLKHIYAFHEWEVLIAVAVYMAACQQIGHIPTIIEMADRSRFWERDYPFLLKFPSRCIPVLAVGQEHELLLPGSNDARDTDIWVPKLLDLIDAVDTFDMVGGDPQALFTVLTGTLTVGDGTLDPRIVVRLAASRLGQAILDKFPVTTVPPIQNRNDMDMYRHILPHLVSPGWATAPPHLREWWETAIRRVAESDSSASLDNPPPLYPTVLPQAAVIAPTFPLVTRAVAHRQWATLPEEDRRACLGRALQGMRLGDLLRVVGHAATDTALRDLCQMMSEARRVSAKERDFLRHLIGLNT